MDYNASTNCTTTKCSTAFSTTAALAVPLAQSSNPVNRMFPTYLLQFHIISWSPAQISHHAWRQLPSCAFLMFSPPPLWSMVMTIVPHNKQEQSLIRTARIIIKSWKWIVCWILRKKGFILLRNILIFLVMTGLNQSNHPHWNTK